MSQPSSLRRSLHQSHPYACLCSGGTRDVGGDDGGADSLSPLPRAGQCVERAAALSGRLLGPPDERDVPPMHPIGAAQDPLFSAGHHLRSPPSPPPTNLGFAPRHPAQQLMNKLYQRSLSQERDQRQMMRDWADGVRQQHERIVPSARKMPMNFLATSSLGTLRPSRSGVSGAAPVGGTIMSAIERAQMPPPPPTMQALSRAHTRQLLDKEDVIASLVEIAGKREKGTGDLGRSSLGLYVKLRQSCSRLRWQRNSTHGYHRLVGLHQSYWIVRIHRSLKLLTPRPVLS